MTTLHAFSWHSCKYQSGEGAEGGFLGTVQKDATRTIKSKQSTQEQSKASLQLSDQWWSLLCVLTLTPWMQDDQTTSWTFNPLCRMLRKHHTQHQNQQKHNIGRQKVFNSWCRSTRSCRYQTSFDQLLVVPPKHCRQQPWSCAKHFLFGLVLARWTSPRNPHGSAGVQNGKTLNHMIFISDFLWVVCAVMLQWICWGASNTKLIRCQLKPSSAAFSTELRSVSKSLG